MFVRMGGFVGLAMFAIWIYCVIDVIATDGSLMRNLSKPMWVIIVVFTGIVGSVVWLAVGRPQRAGYWPGDTNYRRPLSTRFTTRGPEDDASFIPPSTRPESPAPSGGAGVDDSSLARREAELRRREEEVARRERELRGDDEGNGGMYGHRW